MAVLGVHARRSMKSGGHARGRVGRRRVCGGERRGGNGVENIYEGRDGEWEGGGSGCGGEEEGRWGEMDQKKRKNRSWSRRHGGVVMVCPSGRNVEMRRRGWNSVKTDRGTHHMRIRRKRDVSMWSSSSSASENFPSSSSTSGSAAETTSSGSSEVGSTSGDAGSTGTAAVGVEDVRAAATPLGAFWKFLRPHTIRGTVVGSVSVTSRALLESPGSVDWTLVPRALLGVLALLCGNGYIVGINQIYDEDIDRVNKPFLPVASGEMSPQVAWAAVLALAAMGCGITAANFGALITALYAFGLFLGTIYSVPPLRLKRFALPAFCIIATVRGFLLNFGVYHAARAALKLPFRWSPAIVFITTFSTIFATVIAITKDLPDVDGDKKYDIKTFATTFGVERVSWMGIGLLLANYVGAIAVATLFPFSFNAPVMVTAHVLLALSLINQLRILHVAEYAPSAVKGMYRYIWNCFYMEYALLPAL